MTTLPYLPTYTYISIPPRHVFTLSLSKRCTLYLTHATVISPTNRLDRTATRECGFGLTFDDGSLEPSTATTNTTATPLGRTPTSHSTGADAFDGERTTRHIPERLNDQARMVVLGPGDGSRTTRYTLLFFVSCFTVFAVVVVVIYARSPPPLHSTFGFLLSFLLSVLLI